METETPSLYDFLPLPSSEIASVIYKQRYSISLLINGTRRWYIAEHFEQPPQDHSYFPHYLETVLNRLADLLAMLTEHGLYRIFIPVYSWYQFERNAQAHEYLLKGIEALRSYPALVSLYERMKCAVRFYGDPGYLPEEFATLNQTTVQPFEGEPQHLIYFGLDGGNPHDYTLKLAHQFSQEQGRPPTWEDMLEMYYGDRSLRRLEILIGFNRIYSRGGIPHLLEGGDRIYVTAVTPLVLSQQSLRTVLHDYIYNSHDFGRDYKDLHPNEIRRLKQFYAANSDTVMGVMRKYENLVYPLPGVRWPAEMDQLPPASPPER